MKKHLLLLDGSAACYRAAQTSWMLSDKLDATLTALHIVDTEAAFKLVKVSRPGLIGSGPYVNALETIKAAMTSLAETVADAYASYASGRLGKDAHVIVEEGSPTEVLRRNLSENDLLILGYRRADEKVSGCDNLNELARTAIYEGEIPTLFVQELVPMWKVVRIIIGKDGIELGTLQKICAFAGAIEARTQIYLACSDRSMEKAFQRLKETLEQLDDGDAKSIEVLLRDINDLGGAWQAEMSVPPDVLPVFLTFTELHGDRRTATGAEPEQVLKDLEVSALMVWPAVRPSVASSHRTSTNMA